MTPIDINKFIDELGETLDSGLITTEQYDEFMYRCASIQAYKPSQLQITMERILNEISMIKEEKESNQ